MSSSDSDTTSLHTPTGDQEFPDSVQLLRSCESCRRKKRKCSGDRPTCSRCKAQGEECTYRPTARFLKPRSNMVRKTHTPKKKRASLGDTSLGTRPRAMSAMAAALSSEQPHQHMSLTVLAPADLMLSPPLSITPAGLSPGSVSDAADVSPRLDVGAAGLSYMTPNVFPAGRSTASPQMLLASELAPQLMYPQPMVPPLCDAADYSQLLASAITQQQATAMMAVTSGMMPNVQHPMNMLASLPDASLAPPSMSTWPDPTLFSPMYPMSAQDSRANSTVSTLDSILPQPKNIFSEWFVQ
ncbi:hypothetical protein IWW50_005368 [Coemansia erecta]|nr:hypothetical protein GGF43_004164 [Coemansia sp. RSA 2618]KAJ2819689.1 hypothetical protein IWW50_005368 [Coemansia erecta]